ncbi:DUF58 domain-containing protein [Marilutibacter alkalisoli]|uniref:DUF58 domain-containing protein n=1 Tax=Marilutibacter alkalisoli TaxID=2591633 RepID=A0A514BT08_9GAMM|nr:DUF58 domain-containing protein [Lysobacter alkalisoli]QDH70526.1 DUF58 domain-containing protein [Lysobacter alkalisoli]
MSSNAFRHLHDRMLRWARPRTPEPLPAVFDRRRIYVLPTRFGLFYSMLLAVMGLGALNYNNNPALLLALLLAGAGLASLIAAQLQLSQLEVVAIDAEPVAAGTPLRARLHVRAAPGRIRRGLRVDMRSGRHDAIILNLSGDRGEADVELATEHRGWLDIPRLRISTTRPLGLARAWAYVWPQAPLLVYPAPEPDGPPLPEGRGEAAQSRLKSSGEDVHHLRAWRAGDARRAIAWKASARRDQLLVREYEQPLGVEVVLDWRATAGLPYESRIARLAHWIDLAERERRRYRLAAPGQPGLGPDHGPRHRHACLRALALMPHG